MSKLRSVLVVVAFVLLGSCGDVRDPEDSVDPAAVVEIQSPFTTGARCTNQRNCIPIAHAVASCRNNRCNYSCITGFKECGGRCIPNANCCTSADCAGAGTVCGGTCGSNGVCSFPTGTCSSATCASSTARRGAGFCSGGLCLLPAPVSCGVNLTCTGAGVCTCPVPGFKVCPATGACVPASSCCANADCVGSNAACSGTCGTNGQCTYPNNNACGTASCLGNNRIGPGTCSAGTCVFPAPIACANGQTCTGAGICI